PSVCYSTATCSVPRDAISRRTRPTTARRTGGAEPPAPGASVVMQRTLVLAKPDAVQRGLVGEILARFERKGFKVVGLRFLSVGRQMAGEHSAVHAGKHFYAGLVEFITSGPVAAIALEGPDAIAVVRRMVGKTMPNEAEPGTIRGDLGISGLRNLIHASDA